MVKANVDEKRLPFPCASDETYESMTSRDGGICADDDNEVQFQTVTLIGDGEACGAMRERDEETTPPGFEPGQREPKSLVLPLHYGVTTRGVAAADCYVGPSGHVGATGFEPATS